MSNEQFPKKNLLKDLIYLAQTKPVKKTVIEGLFKFGLEALIEAQYHKSLVLLRLKDQTNFSGILQRLEYAHTDIYSFSDNLKYENLEKKNIWGDTEFLIILSPRYSLVLIWDYSTESVKESSSVCYMLNSKSVNNVISIISNNSKIDLMRYTQEFTPERRGNETLNNTVNKFISFSNDIFEENIASHAENSILEGGNEEAKKYAYISSKAKSIAHEIKNHVSIINLYTKIMDKRLAEIEDNEKKSTLNNALGCIKKSSSAISQLLAGLRTIQPPNLENICAKDVLQSAISMVSLAAAEKDVEIKEVASVEAQIYADETKLMNVLINLFYNAIDAVDRGGKIEVATSLTDDNMLRISITDNGCGISEEDVNKIFLEGYSSKSLGNGLGLFISKNCMQEQYGDLQLVRSDKNGTTFDILIPCI